MRLTYRLSDRLPDPHGAGSTAPFLSVTWTRTARRLLDRIWVASWLIWAARDRWGCSGAGASAGATARIWRGCAWSDPTWSTILACCLIKPRRNRVGHSGAG